MSLLELNGVTVSRGGADIIHDISWQTNDSEHWVIMGPNGAGKTTLMRALTGREYVTSGSISILGRSLWEHDSAELGTLVGFSSSSLAARLRPGQTARDVVRTAAWGQNVSFDEEYESVDDARADDVMAAFGVAHLAERRFSTLSEGERQRVLLARALMTDPEVLILDEPTAGLDLGARELLMQALSAMMSIDFAPQVIIITHHVEEIPVGMTHALLMKDGGVAAAGPIDSVLTGVEVSRVFDIPLNVSRHNGRWTAQAVTA